MQQTEARSPQGTFELPCGYFDMEKDDLHTTIEISELTGAEEDIFFSNLGNAALFNQVLGNRIERIGTITDKNVIRKIVPELVVGDRLFCLIALRRVGEGDIFKWFDKCPLCGQMQEISVDLSTLETFPTKDPKVRVYDYTLPRSGKNVRWKVMDGVIEARRDKLLPKHPKDRGSIVLLLRMEALDNKPPKLENLKALPMHDRTQLRKQIEDYEGGIETSVKIDCTGCFEKIEMDINITDKNFFFPEAGE